MLKQHVNTRQIITREYIHLLLVLLGCDQVQLKAHGCYNLGP